METEHNPSGHFRSCSYCNALLPAYGDFCSACDKRVEQKENAELGTNTKPGSSEAQKQESETLRPASLSQIHQNRVQPHRSLHNNVLPGRSNESGPALQDREAPVRSNLLWPTIIIFSAVAAGLVNVVFTNTIVRPFVVFWFLVVCPGMIVVRFLRLKEPIVEWTLALALSFVIDAIVAAIQLYAGRWSPAGTLTILISLTLCGAFVQLANSTKSVPILLLTVRSSKSGVLLPILLTLLVVIIVGASLWSYEVYHGSHSATSTSALPYKATPHSSPKSTEVSTPPSTSSANIAELYYGTIYDIPANVTTKMSLTGIQQTQITISGNFTGLHRTGIFNGIIDPSKHIQFAVKDSAGHLILSFDGTMQSDGDLSGSYCSVDQDAQCTGEYGLWSVAPAS